MSRVLMLFSFSLGIFFVGFWPDLPDSIWLLLPAIAGFVLYVISFMGLYRVLCFMGLYRVLYRGLACLLCGVIYGVFWGHYTLSHQSVVTAMDAAGKIGFVHLKITTKQPDQES